MQPEFRSKLSNFDHWRLLTFLSCILAETLKNIFGFMGGNEILAVLMINKKFFLNLGQKYFMSDKTKE